MILHICTKIQESVAPLKSYHPETLKPTDRPTYPLKLNLFMSWKKVLCFHEKVKAGLWRKLYYTFYERWIMFSLCKHCNSLFTLKLAVFEPVYCNTNLHLLKHDALRIKARNVQGAILYITLDWTKSGQTSIPTNHINENRVWTRV